MVTCMTMFVIMEIPFHMHKPAIFLLLLNNYTVSYLSQPFACTELYAEKRSSKLNIIIPYSRLFEVLNIRGVRGLTYNL